MRTRSWCAAALTGLITAVTGITSVAVQAPAHASTVGGAITRAEVLQRAQWWIDTYSVIYSQDQSNAKPDPDGHRYRPDCSGFVSMAWHLPKKSDGWDRSTRDLTAFGDTRDVGLDQLMPGDAILAYGHVALFDKWTDSSRTRMWIYEEYSTTQQGRHVIKDKSFYAANGYRGVRYTKIVDSVPGPADDVAQRADGDFNGDGRSDVVALYNYDNAHVKLWTFLSGGSGFTSHQIWWDSGVGTFDWHRIKLAAGDFNADGRDDVALLYKYDNARSVLFTAISTGSGFVWPQGWWDSGEGNFDWDRIKLAAGDFNADGRTDAGLLYSYDKARTVMYVGTSTGTGFGWPQGWWDSGEGVWDGNHVKLATGDFNADGRTDIGMLYRYDNALARFFTATSTGAAFAWPQQWYDSGAGNWDANRSKLA